MSFHMLLNTDRAGRLARAYAAAASDCERTRTTLTPPLADAAGLTGRLTGAPLDTLARLRDRLIEGHLEVAGRVRMVLLGGDEVNAGLWALDVIERNYLPFDVGRDGDPAGADGVISRADLEALAAERSGELAAAAAFLLAHPGFLTAVDDAEANRDYLDALGEGRFASGSGDGRFDLGDIHAYREKLSTWATVLVHASSLDVAAEGDPAGADGHLSADDFAAVLDDPAAPLEVRAAALRVLSDRAFHTRSRIDWDTIGPMALDAAGYVPIVGDGVDAGRALWYASQGDWMSAAIYAGGVLPIPGVSGNGLRATRDAVDALRRVAVDEGVDAAIHLGFRETARGVGVYSAVATTTWGARQVTDNEVVGRMVGESAAVTTRRRFGSEVTTTP